MNPAHLPWLLLATISYSSCANGKDKQGPQVKLETITRTDTPNPIPPPPIPITMPLQQWIFNICDTEKPKQNIIAYHFGIFKTPGNGYTVYLTGSKEYDKNDDDWALNEDFKTVVKRFPLPAEYRKLKWEQAQEKIVPSSKALQRQKSSNNPSLPKQKPLPPVR